MADLPLHMVDGLLLPPEYRGVLRPGEPVRARDGAWHRLPRFFYEIPSWEAALETQLSRRFTLWEFMNVDVREAELLRTDWPRYIPCGAALLAAHLEVLRSEVGTYIHIAANGGYRSPAHRLSTHASTHCWGTAANLYRIGDDWLDDRQTIARYAAVVRRLMPQAFVRPFGYEVGEACDHLHIDLGYTVFHPHGASETPDEDAPAGA